MDSIRECRKRLDMTLKEVSQVTGLSVSFLSDLERGESDPSLSSLRLLAQCFGVPVTYFLEKQGFTFDTVRVPVPEFYIQPSLLFLCVFCGVANHSRRHGEHHMATGDHCDNCGAYYDIHWETPPEKSVIHMARAVNYEEEEK